MPAQQTAVTALTPADAHAKNRLCVEHTATAAQTPASNLLLWLLPPPPPPCCCCCCPQVRIWDVKTQTCLVTLSGHSGAVTALRFSRDGALLASGSADTTLVVWDVVGEAGLCRFKGHKDAVTDLVSWWGGGSSSSSGGSTSSRSSRAMVGRWVGERGVLQTLLPNNLEHVLFLGCIIGAKVMQGSGQTRLLCAMPCCAVPCCGRLVPVVCRCWCTGAPS